MTVLSFYELYASLDPYQKQVADWRPAAGNLRVVATAGSGKTTSLTALVASLLNANAITPSRFYVTTYSNKAGEELRARIEPLVNPGTFAYLHIGTFHALALRELRRADKAAWNIQVCVDADPKERKTGIPAASYLWDLIAGKGKAKIPGTTKTGLGLKDTGKALSQAYSLARAWDFGKPDDMTPEYIRQNKPPARFREAWRLYEEAKTNLGAWDFDDVLTAWGQTLTTPRADVIIVDEAQDNDRRMINIAEKLFGFNTANAGRIILIGDPSQTIHEWKGAYPDLFMEADVKYNAKTISLPINYRSGEAIVTLGNKSIKTRPWSLAMQAQPTSVRGHGSVALLGGFADAVDEASAVVGAIELALTHGAKGTDFCVLARTNAELGIYSAILRDKGIPFTSLGVSSIFETREGIDVLSYIRLSLSDDAAALGRIANRPSRYLKTESIEAMKQSVRNGNTVIQACQSARISTKDMNQARAISLLEETLRKIRRVKWPDVISVILSMFVTADGSLADEDEEEDSQSAPPDEDRPAVYGAIAGIAKKFTNVADFLRFVQKCEDSQSKDAAKGVLLSTIHKMKGGERKTVFLAASDGSLPHWRSLPSNGKREWFGPQLDAELRLWYVAVTRARDVLVLTWNDTATKNRLGGKSRFIERFVKGENADAESN